MSANTCQASDARLIGFYLAPKVLHSMEHGKGHQFFSIAKAAFERLGHSVILQADDVDNLTGSKTKTDYAMFHFKTPMDHRTVDVRRTAIGPFYSIEREPHRWDYRLVNAQFDPFSVSSTKAHSFFMIWQARVAPNVKNTALRDFVLIALQGKLLDCRRGQEMSPIDMIRTTIAHERSRQILVKLHPKEKYSLDELAAIREICIDPRVQVYEGDLNEALQSCAYVVAQNSSVLLKGLFYRKPGIVFADCEFHHPFHSIRKEASIESAFANVLRDLPAFEEYAYWYFQQNCINTSRDWAGDMILQQVRNFGWKV